MAKEINVKVVSTNIITHGLFLIKSNKSSFTVDCCFSVGTTRSFVVKKVINNMMVPITASQVITISIPTALSPSPA
ncbi:MAG: Uncharacterised protein [Formosa sp. Hel3_A1_48]|nr:MAG: Uncharacterised protein [Formosa sp. Hel3_A1_48]